MNLDAQQQLKLRRLLFIALLGMIGVSIVLALTRRSEWIIPEKAKQRVNPMQPSAQTLNAALGLYKENCARCHGDTGKGDGRDAWKHYTTPSDLTNAARMSNLTDGALFYQISEGRRPMPQFKTRLTEEQRWQVVLLIRSFAGATEKESKDP